MSDYVHPEVLVSTQWVADNIDNSDVVIVESNEDILLYETGHIPGAVKVDWQNELQDQLIRDYVGREDFEKLMSKKGITNDHTVVFYGDRSNWWACYAFWTFKVLGHEKCLIMNGGRQKWVEEGRPMTKDISSRQSTNYKVHGINESIRAFRSDVEDHISSNGRLIDVRSPKEFTGELTHMENYPQEGCLRGGTCRVQITFHGQRLQMKMALSNRLMNLRQFIRMKWE